MTAVHENVHQWACSEKKPWQERKDMGAVLNNQKERPDDGENGERHLRARSPSAVAWFQQFQYDRLLQVSVRSNCERSQLPRPTGR